MELVLQLFAVHQTFPFFSFLLQILISRFPITSALHELHNCPLQDSFALLPTTTRVNVWWYDETWFSDAVCCCTPYHLNIYHILAPLITMQTERSIVYTQATFLLFLAHFSWSLMASCTTYLFVQVMPEAVHRWASPVSIGKFVEDYSSGRPLVICTDVNCSSSLLMSPCRILMQAMNGQTIPC